MKTPEFKNKGIKYCWKIEDSFDNLNQLNILKNHISGLFFGIQQTHSRNKVEEMTRKILQSGVQLEQIICEGEAGKLEELTEWKRDKISWKGE